MRAKFPQKTKYSISLISTAHPTDFKAIEGNIPNTTAQTIPSGKSYCRPKFITILTWHHGIVDFGNMESHGMHKVQPEQ